MAFKSEADFERELVNLLSEKGWEKKTLDYYTEDQLKQNWANILFENNRDINRLNDYPLTDGEMDQIIRKVSELKTPLKLNGFINGKTVSIKRDNPNDLAHFGKEVALKIYDRREIAAGQSRYQIARQPRYARVNHILNDRRGDLMLLINGMPVIHIELKKSSIPISQACYQCEKYAYESVFTGIFSLVQILVAMTPDETLYFANPGPEGRFNKDYYFNWADFNNEPINYWKDIASTLLSIPMAHQLIGFYTIADDSDGILKVMRSYQYYAANAISDKVSKTKWDSGKQRGGYIWHTTGSGKTMTSFKSAQLIANSNDADKVVFLTDRIELGTQSLKTYRAFADDVETVQETEDTRVLITKLKSTDMRDTLIVTSIQKMSNIREEEKGLNAKDIELINSKRLVFIIDEAHRSTFGEMLLTIKNTFPNAIFFGFTGTPIHEENKKKLSTTATVFGNELHRYSIADGIRDKNVLGFDPYKVLTYKDRDLRVQVALEKVKAKSEAEALADPVKAKQYYKYIEPSQTKMYGERIADGTYVAGIEDFIPMAQYRTSQHQAAVVQDIRENYLTKSKNRKFHAIFATSSINEAIQYYRLIKQMIPEINVTSLFDPNIDNNEGFIFKEEGLVEILQDYNAKFGQNFGLYNHAAFKRDVASRLAHKDQYIRIEKTPEEQLDLLIVVDQMLTGFDSKWINTLYLDKILAYESIIQAFSRTNRLFGEDKPFGVIRYYRKPHTMEQNVFAAVKLYSGDKPLGLYVEKLPHNLKMMNLLYEEIVSLFVNAQLPNFEKPPAEISEKAQFAKLFSEFNTYHEAARVQGFVWEKTDYDFVDEGTGESYSIKVEIDESLYLTLVQRYKELRSGGNGADEDVPYDIDSYLTEIDTARIDADFMNSRFEKWLKLLQKEGTEQALIDSALDELHKTFATLTQEEQKYANIFLNDILRGDAVVDDGKTLRDYITDYIWKAKDDNIFQYASVFGMDEDKLRKMMALDLNEGNINEYGRFDELKNTIDKEKAKKYFEEKEGKRIPPFKVNIYTDSLTRRFILNDGFSLDEEPADREL